MGSSLGASSRRQGEGRKGTSLAPEMGTAPSPPPRSEVVPAPRAFLLALPGGPSRRAPCSPLGGDGPEQPGALTSVLDTAAAALGTSGRKSEGEASGNVGSPPLSAPRPGPGRAARTVAVTTWLSGRSARQHGLGARGGVSSRPRVSALWASGADAQSPARGAELPLPPKALFVPSACSELAPGDGARGHVGRREAGPRGARSTGRPSRAAGCSVTPGPAALPGSRVPNAALGHRSPRGQGKLAARPSPQLPALPFSSGAVGRTQLQGHLQALR